MYAIAAYPCKYSRCRAPAERLMLFTLNTTSNTRKECVELVDQVLHDTEVESEEVGR